ncbi:MAG: PHP domain-containing protein [Clostridium perfringens]|uniref:TrlF family AAA-like ATPase n=1 Tax=Clostridium perfringens TaxID=1502 RepID=UPI0013E35385|nr:PHP domain-containing protein [Clostridium perfringens]ELC8354481.1 PHP domain-containing protein [Clostridium perfringens]MDK0838059.1 PHP domain-containing protein [Clostridium perfringens]MDK0906724.1 PHP domain-containing protein [Clostridium perfringens]MDU2779900.1 PHP domain-containing protein [Clostridium perfringens]MDU6261143.1 PHP domain-containing protein [Clostridium perfringens]
MINYKGNRWYKCDFHLHTPASKCFANQDVTPEEFINKVIEENLDCIAITDHNNCEWIEEIRRVSKDKNIVVFPGVEITCSDSKVHLLVLFDTDCNVRDIEYFLIDSEVKKNVDGELYTQKSISDIVKKASKAEALVIPSHIDSFSGLSNVDMHIIKDFLELDNIRAVQMVHKELIVGLEGEEKSEDDILEELQEIGHVNYEDAKKYLACAKVIKEKELGILTFSDNPNSEGDSKHGLWGIGKQYSWIKMSENPNLESLRQALLFPNNRIKNCFQKNNGRYKMPDLWIKKVKISNIELLDEDSLEVEFNPQLNTLIGGRGSGKSTVIRFLTGVFFDKNMKQLDEIFGEFKNFYQIKNKGLGVLKKDTEIEVELVKNNIVYRVTKKNIKNIESNSDVIIERLNDNENFEKIEDISVEDFFKIDIYNQKQIYELAKNTNILREKIDSLSNNLDNMKNDANDYLNNYEKKFLCIKATEQEVALKKKILAEIRDLNEKIETYNQSGINEVINKYKEYNKQLEVSRKYFKHIDEKIKILEEKRETLLLKFSVAEDFTLEKEIQELIDESQIKIEETINYINKIVERLNEIKVEYANRVKQSDFYREFDRIDNNYKESLKKLQEKGIDVSEVDKLIKLQQEKQNKLEEIEKKEKTLNEEYKNLKELRKNYINKRRDITNERNSISSKLLNETIRIRVNTFRDKDDFKLKFRKIIDKQTGFDTDIEKVTEFCFNGGEFSSRIEKFYENIYNLKYNNVQIEGYSGRFINVLKELKDSSIAELGILLPEDEIKIQYKSKNSGEYKPIHNASAGQRTSAILTFILSDGVNPLILDQPEDDLDNHLIYSLIVEGLKASKENRQIIVVTHNANIPVNGDAELIISMNSSSKSVNVLEAGTLENQKIKHEICSVMEGGESAFRMRASRYGIRNI